MNDFFKDMPDVAFVTGIGTDVGKSYATGWIARELMKNHPESKIITQKLIQTGNKDFSEDIEVHRKIMGTGFFSRDLDHTTAPLILSYPASPELAARLDNVTVDYSVASKSTNKLKEEFDYVLIEGAGGLMVPLLHRYLTLDYVIDNNLPVIIVTNGQLGSINHTLLTLEVLANRGVKIYGVVYNPYFDKDKIISEDTVKYLREWIKEKLPETYFILMPEKL